MEDCRAMHLCWTIGPLVLIDRKYWFLALWMIRELFIGSSELQVSSLGLHGVALSFLIFLFLCKPLPMLDPVFFLVWRGRFALSWPVSAFHYMLPSWNIRQQAGEQKTSYPLTGCESYMQCSWYRDCSIGKISGLNQAIFSLFCLLLASSKPPTPLHTGPFTLQICTDLRGGQKSAWNRRKSADRRKRTMPANTPEAFSWIPLIPSNHLLTTRKFWLKSLLLDSRILSHSHRHREWMRKISSAKN